MLKAITLLTAVAGAAAFQRIPLNKLESQRSLNLVRPTPQEVRDPFRPCGTRSAQ